MNPAARRDADGGNVVLDVGGEFATICVSLLIAVCGREDAE